MGDGREVPGGARAGTTMWDFSLDGRRCIVEYDHRSLIILLNHVKVEAEAGFLETDDDDGGVGGRGHSSGTRHVFLIPPSMEEAVLSVQPVVGDRGAPNVELTVNGVERLPIGD